MSKPTKSHEQLAKESPGIPGLEMMADREAHLIVRPWLTPAGRKTFPECSNQRLRELHQEVFNARHGSSNWLVQGLIFVGAFIFIGSALDLLNHVSWINGICLAVGGAAVWAWDRQDKRVKSLDQTLAIVQSEIDARAAAAAAIESAPEETPARRLVFDMLDFADRALNAVADAMPSIHFAIERKPQLYAVILHASIVQLCGGCVAMVRSDYRAGIPVLLRSIFEAVIDLNNLVLDEMYFERMDAADRRQMIKLLEESASNPLLAGLGDKHDIPTLIGVARTELSDFEKRGLRPLKVYERCAKVGRSAEYASVYTMLCLDAHNNVTALIERHVTGTEKASLEVAAFGDSDPAVLARRLSFALGWTLQSAEFVHGAFKTGFKVEMLQQEHQTLRVAIEA